MTTTDVLEPPADDAPLTNPDVRPEHVARCPFVDCPAGVRYQLTASGHGAIFLARYGFDEDTYIGLNERKVPLCPFGHGEMELADEQVEEPVSAADAISQVSARQMQLLESPPFNHGACLHELYQKSHEITRLKHKVEGRKESLKIAKEDYDHANEELGKMIAVFEEREQQRNDEIARRELQAANGHPEGTSLVRCLWERDHPNLICPLCHTAADQAMAEKYRAGVAPDAHEHLDRVAAYLDEEELIVTLDVLKPHIAIPGSEVKTWTSEQRAEARAWAAAIEAFDAGGDAFPDLPKIFGRPHIACIVLKYEAQCCTQCDQILRTGGADAEYHEEGRLVGTDCQGRAATDGHRYPTSKGKSKAPRAKRRSSGAKS